MLSDTRCGASNARDVHPCVVPQPIQQHHQILGGGVTGRSRSEGSTVSPQEVSSSVGCPSRCPVFRRTRRKTSDAPISESCFWIVPRSSGVLSSVGTPGNWKMENGGSRSEVKATI